MAKVKNVEKQIWDREGFDVTFKRNGKDVRGDKEGVPIYNRFEKAAKNDWTVADWRKSNCCEPYREFEIMVLDGDGNEVAGNTKLGTVRDSYLDE